MGRLLLSLAIGLVGAVLVHVAVIFAIPRYADHNAWGRFSNLGSLYSVVRVGTLRSAGPGSLPVSPGSERQDFAFVDPAFIAASCRFSLDSGPVRMRAGDPRTSFWSASIYNRRGDNLYSINDRSAVDGTFDLLVGTRDQLIAAKAGLTEAEAEAEADATDPAGTSIPIELNLSEGYMTIRVLVDEESKRPQVENFINSLSCNPSRPLAEIPAPVPQRAG